MPLVLADAIEQLLVLDRARLSQELLRGIAHDLRNAIQVVTLGAGALSQAGPMAERIDEAIDEMTMTIDLLSRLGRWPSEEPAVCDVAVALNSVSELARFQRNIPEVPVRIEVAPKLPLAAISESALIQAALNVVTNAKEAQPDVAIPVEIRATHVADLGMVEIAVSDRGPGLPADAGQPLATTKSPTAHGGIGLFAATTLVERAGGRVGSSRVADGGTRVVLLVPAVEERAPHSLDMS